MTYSHKEYMEWKRLAETVLDVKKIKLGLMVETPAAALTIEDFVQDIQFVVFGSNDLTQFTLAIDRNNPHLIEMFNEKEKAVLKLMKMVIDVCNRYNIETTIGGQAGSDEEMVDILLSYGISGVSVNPDPWTVDRVRRFIESKES
jgi:pyruvate,water dikinase